MSEQPVGPAAAAHRWERQLVGLIALGMAFFFVWTVRSNGDAWRFGEEQRDHYNLLIDGWLDGQLYMKVAVPEALLNAKDPYDPAQRPPGVTFHDASFYRGKYYLYFGAGPVVLLMLPFRLITGMDLPLAVAVLVFVYLGFWASSEVWLRLRARYFPEASSWVAYLGVFALGVVGLGPVLLRRPHVWELPVGAGYAFAMLTLLCLFHSLHARARRGWFAAAGASLAFAIAARPTYMMALPLLLLPVLVWWREEKRLHRREVFAALVPLAIVGGAMGLHNWLRFGNPLEFGQNYQLSSDYESKIDHFSLRYLAFNFRVYFTSLADWSWYFPFIAPGELPAVRPLGYTHHLQDRTYGLFVNLPLTWFALLAPLALWRRCVDERRRIGVWFGALAILFAGMVATMLCFFGSGARYQFDFAPLLVLLALVGVLAVERLVRFSPASWPKWGMRFVWGSALAFSSVFAVLFSLQLNGFFAHRNPAKYHAVARTFNRLSAGFQTLAGVRHGTQYLTVRFPTGRANGEEELVYIGDGSDREIVLVRYLPQQQLQLGFRDSTGFETWSHSLPVKDSVELAIRTGRMLPPDTFPLLAEMSSLDRARLTQRAQLAYGGELVVEVDTYRARSGEVPRWAKLQVDSAQGGRSAFSGKVLTARREALDAAGKDAPLDFVRLRLEWPEVAQQPQALLAWSEGQAGSGVFFERSSPGHVRLLGMAKGGVAHLGAEIAVAKGRVDELRVEWRASRQADTAQVLAWIGDSLALSTSLPWQSADAAKLVVGKASSAAPVFAGRIHSVERGEQGQDPLLSEGDTVRLMAVFPSNRVGAAEPLVITGRTGAADQVAVEYLDGNRIRFLFDHWGQASWRSEPVEIDPARAHQIDITLGSLAARANDVGRSDRRGRLRITLNGRTLCDDIVALHSNPLHSLTVGRNRIGGSACGPVFTGKLLSVRRGIFE